MGSGKHKTITLTKLDDTSHYCLWRVATEATFDVHNILSVVLATEPKLTSLCLSLALSLLTPTYLLKSLIGSIITNLDVKRYLLP